MRLLTILPTVMLLAACSGYDGNAQDRSSGSSDDVTVMKDETVTAAPSAAANTLPFDMPIMDGARYISGSPKFSKPSKRRGGEAIATIAVKGTPLDVVEYYTKELSERGFAPTQGANNSESGARVAGINAAGEKFSITVMSGGSKSQAGESTAALIATKPKLNE